MASASYAEAQARSSEGEKSREKIRIRAEKPTKSGQCLYSRCRISKTVPNLAFSRSEKNSAVLVQPLYIRSKRKILVDREIIVDREIR